MKIKIITCLLLLTSTLVLADDLIDVRFNNRQARVENKTLRQAIRAERILQRSERKDKKEINRNLNSRFKLDQNDGVNNTSNR